MRLLNVNTLELKWFTKGSPDFPPYVIASHTWEKEEFTYEEYEAWLQARAANPRTPEPNKAGFRKIREFCKIAREEFRIVSVDFQAYQAFDRYHPSFSRTRASLRSQSATEAYADIIDMELRRSHEARVPLEREHAGLRDIQDVQWVWLDSCCIDKRSSAELSEAINSMFKWYEDAATCVAYLQDVNHTHDKTGGFQFHSMINSKWFTRGWTLQELIAPWDVHFYDGAWSYCCSRSTFFPELAELTSIDWQVLHGHGQKAQNLANMEGRVQITRKKALDAQPIALKLSWAARRMTTRTEDNAYCLLGLLNVNMPLLYGEGDNAFARLQETVMRNSQDQSILLWQGDDQLDDRTGYVGCLAKRHSQFRLTIPFDAARMRIDIAPELEREWSLNSDQWPALVLTDLIAEKRIMQRVGDVLVLWAIVVRKDTVHYKLVLNVVKNTDREADRLAIVALGSSSKKGVWRSEGVVCTVPLKDLRTWRGTWKKPEQVHLIIKL